MLSKMKSLLEKLSLVRISDLLWRFFLLIRMLHFCLSTFNFNNYSVLFLQTVICLKISVLLLQSVMLEDHQVSPHDWLGTMPCNFCFQEHHHQYAFSELVIPSCYSFIISLVLHIFMVISHQPVIHLLSSKVSWQSKYSFQGIIRTFFIFEYLVALLYHLTCLRFKLNIFC